MAAVDIKSETLRQQLAAAGFNTEERSFRKDELAARRAAAQRFREIVNENDKARDPSALYARRLINAGLNWAATIVSGVIMVVGLITALMVVVAVEIAAVEAGLRATKAEYTMLYAVGLVFIYLVLAFYLEAVKKRDGESQQIASSLRIWIRNLIYFLGLAPHWTPRFKQRQEEGSAVKAVMNLTLGAILFFGVMGRIPHLLESAPGNWFEALIFLVTQSSLTDMVLIIGTLFAMTAALLGTRKLVGSVYLRFHVLTGGMENDSANFLTVYSVEDLIEEEMRRLYQQKLLLLQSENQNKNPTEESAVPA